MLTLKKVKTDTPKSALEMLLETGVPGTDTVIQPNVVNLNGRSMYAESSMVINAQESDELIIEMIDERAVICKSCNSEFTTTRVQKHDFDSTRGYVTCPHCSTRNDIKKRSLFPNRIHRRTSEDYYNE